ncbi:MAG: hypothetical protein ACOC6D_08510 [Atribacterota bacterium]
MNKKTILVLIISIVIALVIGGGTGYYIGKNSQQEITNPALTSSYKPAAEKGTTIEKDDFYIYLPRGWAEAAQPPVGVSLSAVNQNEQITDPAAKRINFQSYYSVVYDSLGENTKQEYYEEARQSLINDIPGGGTITKEETKTINGRESFLAVVEFTQREITFKAMVVIIPGENKDMWMISFNTLENKWDDYQDLFYQIAESFELK